MDYFINHPIRKYTITRVNTGKSRKVSSRQFSFDTVKRYYKDILKGEYYSPTGLSFYSPRCGTILCSWE